MRRAVNHPEFSEGSAWSTEKFSLAGVASVKRQVVSGNSGYGFQIIPDPANPGVYPVKVWIRGVGNKGWGYVYVTGPEWRKGAFSAIAIEDLGYLPGGDWLVEIGLTPDCMKIPAGTDAVSGRAPLGVLDEQQILTRAAPALVTEGVAIAGKHNYFAFFEAPAGQIITGGNGDLWRFDNATGLWALVLSIPLPIGGLTAALPVDSFGVVNAGDRFLVASNGIGLSGAGVNVISHMRAQ